MRWPFDGGPASPTRNMHGRTKRRGEEGEREHVRFTSPRTGSTMRTKPEEYPATTAVSVDLQFSCVCVFVCVFLRVRVWCANMSMSERELGWDRYLAFWKHIRRR